jgi:hypothetical protein
VGPGGGLSLNEDTKMHIIDTRVTSSACNTPALTSAHTHARNCDDCVVAQVKRAETKGGEKGGLCFHKGRSRVPEIFVVYY